MTFLIYYVIGWIVGLAAMFVTGSTKDISSAAYILLLYQLTVTVGLTGILGGYGHLFMGKRVAPQHWLA